jgi:hypothetical protein
MRLLLSAIVAAGSFTLATAAFTQSAPIRSRCSGQSRSCRSPRERQTVCLSNRLTRNERPRAKRSNATLRGTGSP